MPAQRLTFKDKREIAEMVADMLEERFKVRQILLTPAEAAAVLGTTARALQQMRYDGNGPPFVRLHDGEKAPVRYDRNELHVWATTRPRYTATRLENERPEPESPQRVHVDAEEV